MVTDDVLKRVGVLASRLNARRPDIQENIEAFKGETARMRFASEEFRSYFERRFKGFVDNWCMPVAQAPIERMHHIGFRLPDKLGAEDTLARIWDANDADLGLSEALMLMTVARRSFALVSPGTPRPRITFEHPDSAIVSYDPVTRERREGFTTWQDDTVEYGVYYTPEMVAYVRRAKLDIASGSRVAVPAGSWDIDSARRNPVQVNPLGVVPLVEFRNLTLLDNDPISDIAGVKSMQDAINLVWAYLLNALDYASLPARVVTGSDAPKVPVLDENGQIVGTRPLELDLIVKDRVLFLPSETAKIQEWSAANLDVFSKVIEHAVEHIAAQTRTPPHYLIASSSNTPATGYELAEAGLVSKAGERVAYANPSLREIYRLTALADNKPGLADQVAAGRPLWKKLQYRSEQQLMDGLQKLSDAGFPFQWVAEEYGLSPSDVKRVMDMRRQEARDMVMFGDDDPEVEAVADVEVSP